MGDEAYKAWGLRATIVAMRPLTLTAGAHTMGARVQPRDLQT